MLYKSKAMAFYGFFFWRSLLSEPLPSSPSKILNRRRNEKPPLLR